MSVVDTKVRADAPVNPRTHVVGRPAAAAYMTAAFGLPLNADVLTCLAIVGEGPPIDGAVDGGPIYAKRALAAWVIVEYGDHDGNQSEMTAMLWRYFNGERFVPKYCAETEKVDLVYIWIEETPPTDEENAARVETGGGALQQRDDPDDEDLFDEIPLTAEENATCNAERDLTDPILGPEGA
jgi:hypothetical protein